MAILNALNGSIGSSSGSSSAQSYSSSMGSGSSANKLALQMMEKANQFNAQQAQLQRDWEEKMSNSEMQRRVEDLKKAGINPILAYTNGASTPGGSSATSVMPTFQTDYESSSESHGENSSTSESGLASGLALMGKYLSEGLGKLKTEVNLNIPDIMSNIPSAKDMKEQWDNRGTKREGYEKESSGLWGLITGKKKQNEKVPSGYDRTYGTNWSGTR